MVTIKIVGLVIIGVFFIIIVASVIAYLAIAVPAMKKAPPLTPEQIEQCRKIVASRKGYPWVCKKAIKTGRCPCQPCPKSPKK